MRVEELRQIFPILSRKVYGKDLVYFDNAATIQRPQSVVDMWNKISIESNANIHRAVHKLADEATSAYEQARETVRKFINAPGRENIIFTSGTTASVNMVAYSFGEKFVSEGDEIIVSAAEHHSNIVPWQLLCSRKGAVLKVIPVLDNGCLDISTFRKLLTDRTKIVAVAHISNVLGIVNPVKEIVRLAHERGVPVLVDGAQGIVHSSVDVQEMDCDFYAFSGHKIYAATGTGVLYGKKKFLDEMPPFMGGGEMVGTVSFDSTTFAPLPLKFEAGTQNFAGAATFIPALELAEFISKDTCLKENETNVKEYMYESLIKIDSLTLYGTPDRADIKIPLFSFSVDGVHHEDLALILDKMGIAARSGQMCAEPVMERFGVSGMLRVSLAPYNTMQEAEYFIVSLKKAIGMLR